MHPSESSYQAGLAAGRIAKYGNSVGDVIRAGRKHEDQEEFITGYWEAYHAR